MGKLKVTFSSLSGDCFAYVTRAISEAEYPLLRDPPCASTGLSKHGVGIEPLFSDFVGLLFFVVLKAGLSVRDVLIGGALSAMQLFGHVAALETHTL